MVKRREQGRQEIAEGSILPLANSARASEPPVSELNDSVPSDTPQSAELKPDWSNLLSQSLQDLRGPMNTLMGLAESLLQNKDLAELPAVQDSLRVITQSGMRVNRTIDEIADWTRIHRNELTLHHSPIALSSLVDGVVAACAHAQPGMRIQLRNDVPVAWQIESDDVRLEHLLRQCLSHAILRIGDGDIRLDAEAREREVVLSLRCRGSNIVTWPFLALSAPSDEHNAVHEALCYELSLRLEVACSEHHESGGTVLDFHLKRLADAAQSTRSGINVRLDDMPESSIGSAQALILVVDDDAVTRQVIGSYLRVMGHRIVFAKDGMEALHCLHEQTPELVVMDVVMPRLDGYGACKRIRERHDCFELPILMVSARTEIEDIVQALDAGANDYVAKPIRGAEFQARIQTLLTMRHVNVLRRQRDEVAEHANAVMRLSLHRAQTDPLTGLPNRQFAQRRFAENLSAGIANGQSLVAIMAGVDDFASVNESLGHEAGDQFLKTLALRLRDIVRDTDLVARWGADQFLLVFTQLDCDPVATEIREKLIANVMSAMQQPVLLSVGEVERNTCIGVVTAPLDSDNANDLLRYLEVSLRHAKSMGAGHIAPYEANMDRTANQYFALQSALSRALKERQITVHYQLQIDMRTRSMMGAEALVRWHHPQRGNISPAEFIPVAESSGLITLLGQIVMAQACTDLRKMMDAGLPIRQIAINVSVHQFRDPQLLQVLRRSLQENNLQPTNVELEITESALSGDLENSIRLLRELRDLGIRLAIDDFGTGYSSLAYLRRFPVHVLKIDQSFVRELPQSEEDAAIVAAIIRLAHTLQLELVAEGIETEAQEHFLRDAGCEFGQGYHLAKPMPLDAFIAAFRNQVSA